MPANAQKLRIYKFNDAFNIHTGNSEGKVKHTLLQNIIQNAEINL